ncbi:sugar transferase [Paenibacillus thermotolerans]|uniref:sugar transferase n=1 Tax=Paenibacillus thermotolerans TaxID=3027807 RepID=UPI003CC6ADF2
MESDVQKKDSGRKKGFYLKFWKRVYDLATGSALFILLSPVFLVISILIKVGTKGPVIFKQKRAGAYGTYFNIYKFRTMRADTPNVATDRLENPEQYITPIGKWLRKTSLDELPQLLNILKGEMSFVGPRPALYNQYELIKSREEQGIDVLLPGLTGLAQINGRDFISDKEKVRYDHQYLNQVSFITDVKILFKTFFSVLTSKGVSK